MQHPLKHPRNTILLGVLFVTIAFIYYLLPYLGLGHLDWAGVTMLAALGIAMTIMAYVLVSGSPNE